MKAMKIEITNSHNVTRFGDLKEGDWFTNYENLDLWVKLPSSTPSVNAAHLRSRACESVQAYGEKFTPVDVVYPVEVTITARRV